jgi:hypothetical protein
VPFDQLPLRPTATSPFICDLLPKRIVYMAVFVVQFNCACLRYSWPSYLLKKGRARLYVIQK